MTAEALWSGPVLVRPIHHPMPLKSKVRALYVSDLHFAFWCAPVLEQLQAMLRFLKPDLLILGGDLVDLPWGWSALERALQRWSGWLPVVAVPGNHDRLCGLGRVKARLPVTQWLDEQVWQHDSGLRLCGSEAQGASETSVFVGHEPHRVGSVARANFPIMLAGHLHGCQWIAWQRRGYDYPGAWFFAYHGPRFRVGPTDLHVSRGFNDTLPVRINCPRDVLLLDLG